MKEIETSQTSETDRQRKFCEDEFTKIQNYEVVPYKISVELQSIGYNYLIDDINLRQYTITVLLFYIPLELN